MTPFGARLRALRQAQGMTLKELAKNLQISEAYLSALEHGRRGRPTGILVHQICQALGIIWDEAEELHRLAWLSHPKVTVDTSGLSPGATELANRLAENIRHLDEQTIDALLSLIKTVK